MDYFLFSQPNSNKVLNVKMPMKEKCPQINEKKKKEL